jgi:hypothetical protein
VEAQATIELLREMPYNLFWFLSPFATRSAPRRGPTVAKFDLMVLAVPEGVSLREWTLSQIDSSDLWKDATSVRHLAKYRVGAAI